MPQAYLCLSRRMLKQKKKKTFVLPEKFGENVSMAKQARNIFIREVIEMTINFMYGNI